MSARAVFGYAFAVSRRARCRIASCLVLLGCARAAAQSSPCGDLVDVAGGDLHVTPVDGAQGVARNAPIVVRHPSAADLTALLATLQSEAGDACSGQPICLLRDAPAGGGASRTPVPGEILRVDDRTLAFVPRAYLAKDTEYYALIARAGFDRASRAEAEFRTGAGVDRDPPGFDPRGEDMRLVLDAPPPECGAPRGSVRVQLGVPAARDDGDEASVELLLFVTSSALDAGAPSLRARTLNRTDGEVVLTFLLEPGEAEGTVCLALRAVDALGRSSRAEPSLCFQPRQGSHFEPSCSAIAPVGAPYGGRGTLVLSSLWLLAALRRRPDGRSRQT